MPKIFTGLQGRNIPTAEEMKHYHYLIDNNGLVYIKVYIRLKAI